MKISLELFICIAFYRYRKVCLGLDGSNCLFELLKAAVLFKYNNSLKKVKTISNMLIEAVFKQNIYSLASTISKYLSFLLLLL